MAGKGGLVEMDYSREIELLLRRRRRQHVVRDGRREGPHEPGPRAPGRRDRSHTVATACSFCMIMMDDGVKVEGKEDSLAGQGRRRARRRLLVAAERSSRSPGARKGRPYDPSGA